MTPHFVNMINRHATATFTSDLHQLQTDSTHLTVFLKFKFSVRQTNKARLTPIFRALFHLYVELFKT